MKNRKSLLKFVGFLTVIALSLLLVYEIKAGNVTILGSLTTISNTTAYSSINSIGSVALPRGTFVIQNGGMTATNALRVDIQMSFDGTNFITAATYRPTLTNATADVYYPPYTNMPVYMRAKVITTESVDVGGIYQN